MILIIVTGCAEIGPPPGGEVDVNGPMLIASLPADGELEVAATDRITLQFDERVVRPEQSKALFVFPRPETEPKLKWDADRVTIFFDQSFRENQTYIVTVSTELKDLRGNRLRGTSTVAFSTGDKIDSGRVAGRIAKGDKPTAGVVVALYPEQLWSDSVVYDSVYPSYVATTDKDGEFDLLYLPEGTFRLIGFLDQNSDERFNPYREEFAVVDRIVAIGRERELEDLNLGLTKLDTLSLDVTSVSVTNNNLVRVRLNKAIDPQQLKLQPERLGLIPVADQGDTIRARGFVEDGDESTSTLTAYVGELPTGVYNLSLSWDGLNPALVYDSIEYAVREDKTDPEVLKFQPSGESIEVSQVDMALSFSEPLDSTVLTSQTFTLWQGETKVPLTYEWKDPMTLSFKAGKMEPGRDYRLDVTEFEIVDLSENPLGDSLVSYSFSTQDEESMGSASGKVKLKLNEPTDAPVQLSFKQTDGRLNRSIVLEAESRADDEPDSREFLIHLPPGKYLVTGFFDRNGDGKRSLGSVLPYTTSETAEKSADTVVVRARFETAGLEFTFD